VHTESKDGEAHSDHKRRHFAAEEIRNHDEPE
jgi:hypothetical protein